MKQQNSWNPSAYLEYADQRLRPALNLLGQIPLQSPQTVVDLGCGPGNVTHHLQKRWPDARISGIDHSPDMLAKARKNHPDMIWAEQDIATWKTDTPIDLIYSNAALHWLPDHQNLFRHLTAQLNEYGCLAVQMPLSWYQPSHMLLREVLEHGDGKTPWGSNALRKKLCQPPVADKSVYYDLLQPMFTHVDIWETEYLQILQGENAIYDWMSGTALLPVLADLNETEQNAFKHRFQQQLLKHYPQRSDGSTLFPFRRLFIVASGKSTRGLLL